MAGTTEFAKTDDAAITTDIKAKMFSDPSLKSASVEVSSRDSETHGSYAFIMIGQLPPRTP